MQNSSKQVEKLGDYLKELAQLLTGPQLLELDRYLSAAHDF